MLRIFDDITIDTSGDLRVVQVEGDWYVTGQGVSIPCRDRADAEAMLLCLRDEARLVEDTPSWVWYSVAVFCAFLVLLIVLTAQAAGAQVTAEVALREGVGEIDVGSGESERQEGAEDEGAEGKLFGFHGRQSYTQRVVRDERLLPRHRPPQLLGTGATFGNGHVLSPLREELGSEPLRLCDALNLDRDGVH